MKKLGLKKRRNFYLEISCWLRRRKPWLLEAVALQLLQDEGFEPKVRQINYRDGTIRGLVFIKRDRGKGVSSKENGGPLKPPISLQKLIVRYI
jgi:hypothetical protein